jgi:hypothetical protein
METLDAAAAPAAITVDAVREQLTLLGHSDVPDDVIAQFLAELQLEPSTPAEDAPAVADAPLPRCAPHPFPAIIIRPRIRLAGHNRIASRMRSPTREPSQ